MKARSLMVETEIKVRYDVVMDRYFTNTTVDGERNGWNCGD